MGFYSFCRRSELLGMKFEHLNFGEDGIQVLIPFSKTDQSGEGRMIFLPKTNDDYCPIKALNNWLEVARIDNGSLFYKINKSNNIETSTLNQKNIKMSTAGRSRWLESSESVREKFNNIVDQTHSGGEYKSSVSRNHNSHSNQKTKN